MASDIYHTSGSDNATVPPSPIPLSNLHHLLTIKLTCDNYLLWRPQLIPYLKGQCLFGYIDGSTPCPPLVIASSRTSVTSASATVSNPAFAHWCEQDQIILSAIISSLSENILTHVVNYTTSRDVWLHLEKMFSSHSHERVLQIKF